MNWKEFLKPDWKKIILTLIFLGLTFVLFVTVYLVPIGCPNLRLNKNCTFVELPQFHCGACAENLTQFDYVYGNLLMILYPVSFITIPGLFLFIIAARYVSYGGLLLTVLYHYLISCLIVLGYNKLKKKKSQNM